MWPLLDLGLSYPLHQNALAAAADQPLAAVAGVQPCLADPFGSSYQEVSVAQAFQDLTTAAAGPAAAVLEGPDFEVLSAEACPLISFPAAVLCDCEPLLLALTFPEAQPFQLLEGSCPSDLGFEDPDACLVGASFPVPGFFAESFAEPFAFGSQPFAESSRQFQQQQVGDQMAGVVTSQAVLGLTVAVEGSHLAPYPAFPLTEKEERNLVVSAHMEEGCWHAEAAELMLAVAAAAALMTAVGSSSSHHLQTFVGTDGAFLPIAVAAVRKHLQPQAGAEEAGIAESASVG